MDRKTAESLLRGSVPGHPLADLLSAAKAPATDRELAGEAAAMAAFRVAAHSPDTAITRRNPMLKLLSLKVAAAAFATTATVGGVALAASTGTIPNPIFASSSAKPSHSKASPSVSPHSKPSSAHPKPSGSASGSPSPKRLADLCKEFDGRDSDGRRRALDDDHFGDLVRKAGKKDRVERFCFDFGKPRPSGSVKPSYSGKPQVSFSARPGENGGGDNGGGEQPGGGDWDNEGK
ncbi:hypothetical protein FB565_001499 [Actinoplanes lutulentus]|uniref:Uncharacterized protein n=1 Tax=Actinoplanes lutulentus TaxID=1287878 RepID=A0A327ZEL9_9ACTN|nr:hypothetical protein [Actinoplanes lutulentus]MBB2941795.1 hypothetical protein [Actinoplanes lutulentus]RAK39715.1 hypothetical protein B0I29_104252 [Actinoplanes lutulentus]